MTQFRHLFTNLKEKLEDDKEEQLISEIKDMENEGVGDIIGSITGLFQDLETRGIVIEGKPFKKPSSYRIN